ncbi:hypothetical protein [Leucobacter sp. G161]|uniref:hypothetical protein n=1 Tax=Leucobacter sp. G161 TaxID=663704 RepID=UPI00073C257C|nr:hypothetical protein [Leucobacter sp. G161]KUF05829.1 hypothetical protein AUL38_03105 [Leucobacter sp. G161]
MTNEANTDPELAGTAAGTPTVEASPHPDESLEAAHSTQAMSDSWGASAALFGAGSLLWPFVFFLAFFARSAMLAAEDSRVPHYGGAWQETIEVVAISGNYVGWVAPSMLALLVGLGFLVTPNADLDSQSVLRPLPFVAALIGGFMLAWTVLSVIVLSTHGPTATSDGGQQLWGLLFITPISVVLALVLGRLDFRPVARRAELLRASIARSEREYHRLADTRLFYGDDSVTSHASRSTWKWPLVAQGGVAVIVFFAFWLVHGESLSTALLEAVYLAAVGALVFLVVSLIQRELIDARLSKLAGHEVRSKLETIGGVILAVGVGCLVLYNLWFVFSGIRPVIIPLSYAALFLAAVWIANPFTLRRSAWPAQVLRERERSLARMRAKLAQLTIV